MSDLSGLANAMKHNDRESVGRMIREHPDLIRATIAGRRGTRQIGRCAELVRRPDGRFVPTETSDPITGISDAFYIACRNGHSDVARFLLSQGRGYSEIRGRSPF